MNELQEKKLTKMLSGANVAQASGVAYSLASVLPVFLVFVFLMVVAVAGLGKDGFMETDWYRYWSFLIPQLSSFFIVAFFIRAKQTSVKEILRPVSWRYFLIAVVLQIGLLSLAELNTWFLEFLGKFGYQDDGIAVPSMDGFGFVGVLFVIAVLPAIFEELLCRELLLKGLKPFGETFAVLLSGALFALFHQNPAQTVYQFCCGATFALVAVKANSALPTMLSHFFNNAFILIATKYALDMTSIYLPFLIFSACCLLGSLAYLLFFDKKKKTEKSGMGAMKTTLKKRDFFLFASVGILVYALTWISVLLSGV